MPPIAFYRFEIVSFIRQYPALFYPLININNRVRHLEWPKYINRETEFVLEGYFRTGNTYAYRAFCVAQPRPVALAFHTHAMATVSLAVRRKIPTLILIRQPADTVISATMKAPGTTVQQHLRWYIRYYEKIYQLRDRLTIALFDEVVKDFGQVIGRVNERFNTQFTAFESTPENVQEVLTWIEEIDRKAYQDDISRYSVPLKAREGLKKSLKEQLERQNPHLLAKADGLYQDIVDRR